MCPMQRDRYPDDWEAISKRIRFERANNRCEQCGVENGALIIRSTVDGARYLVLDEQEHSYRWPNGTPIRLSEIPSEFPICRKETRVVLTVGHLDHDTTNNDDGNLRSWCQRCHLRYDQALHTEHARITRLQKRDKTIAEQGQMSLFEGGES